MIAVNRTVEIVASRDNSSWCCREYEVVRPIYVMMVELPICRVRGIRIMRKSFVFWSPDFILSTRQRQVIEKINDAVR